MSNSVLCCDGCVELISKKSVDSALLWVNICDIQASVNGLLGIKTCGTPELRMLEVLGFVVTTDTSDGLLIKVNGMTKNSIETYFCGGKCNGW